MFTELKQCKQNIAPKSVIPHGARSNSTCVRAKIDKSHNLLSFVCVTCPSLYHTAQKFSRSIFSHLCDNIDPCYSHFSSISLSTCLVAPAGGTLYLARSPNRGHYIGLWQLLGYILNIECCVYMEDYIGILHRYLSNLVGIKITSRTILLHGNFN